MNSLFLLLVLMQADVETAGEQESAYPDNPELSAQGEFARAGIGTPGALVRFGPYLRAEDGSAHFWFHTSGAMTNRGFIRGWTNTLECPGALDVLAALAEVEMPVPVLPLLDDERPNGSMDSNAYRIKVISSYPAGESARITLESWGRSAPGIWVNSMFETLEQCWPESPPEPVE